MIAHSFSLCKIGTIDGVHDIDEERRDSGADWRFICCRGAFGVAYSEAAAARRSGMQRVVACDNVRIGEEEENECAWREHDGSEID